MASASSDQHDDKKKSPRSGFLGKTGTDEVPLDRTYYNILNVSPTASASDIKRAYYTLSLQYHPDRTQSLDDLTRREYAERFKLISQAYSILSDPEKRTLYNRYGKDERLAANDVSEISLEDFDAEEFFRFMFGGEEFINIIGDFEIAKSFKYVMTDVLMDAQKTPEQQQEREYQRLMYREQRATEREQRIDKLAGSLKEKLSAFTNRCDSCRESNQITQIFEDFIDGIRAEIIILLAAPYGEHLLHSIGYIYSSRARYWSSKMDTREGHIGKRIVGFGKTVQSSWKDRIHVIKETVKTVKCAVQWGQSVSKLSQAAEDEEPDESQTPFQHHSGHLEYHGFTSSESTASATTTSTPPPPSSPKTTTVTSVKEKSIRRSSAKPIVPLTDEEKRQLEADVTVKSMEALWRATKLEIESVERDVCDRVLNDSSCSRELLRLRCKALSKIGELWQQASPVNAS